MSVSSSFIATNKEHTKKKTKLNLCSNKNKKQPTPSPSAFSTHASISYIVQYIPTAEKRDHNF